MNEKENYNTSSTNKKETKSIANSFSNGLATGLKVTSIVSGVSGTAKLINAVVEASVAANMTDNKKRTQILTLKILRKRMFLIMQMQLLKMIS